MGLFQQPTSLARMELQPGIRLGIAPRFHVRPRWSERLLVNGGVEREGARLRPRPDWRPPGPEEMAALVDDELPLDGGPPRANLLAIPGRLRAAWWDHDDQPGYERFARELLDFLGFKQLPLPAVCRVEVAASPPDRAGVAADSLDGLASALAEPAAPPVVVINLGDQASHVVLVNLPPTSMADLAALAREPFGPSAGAGEGDGAAASSIADRADLARRFFASRPSYPLVKIRLEPGEGVWLPDCGMIGEGRTARGQELDVLLTIRAGAEAAGDERASRGETASEAGLGDESVSRGRLDRFESTGQSGA